MDTTNLLYRILLYISLFMILSTVSFVMLCSYSLMNDSYTKGELRYKLMEMKRKFEYALDSLTKPCKA